MKKLIICLIILIISCTKKNSLDENLPVHVRDVENVMVYSLPENSNKIQLTKSQTYGDSEDLFFSRMGEFVVDDVGRIFIEESAVGRKTIHIFAPDGNHLGNIGREGRGPGEFEDICCMKTISDNLYVYDPVQTRISLFSLEEMELMNVFNIEKTDLPGLDTEGRFTGTYFPVNSEKILMSFGPPGNDQKSRENLYNTFLYFDQEFQQVSSEILKQKQIPHHWGYFEGYRIRETFPFFKKPLIAVSQSGRIYTAMSDYFFVQELDQDGSYLQSFYYPIEEMEVTREDAYNSSNEMSRDIAERLELPQNWPVLNSMQFDDEERLWISTFTEKEDQLKWWVLNTNGELLGTFYFKGDRYAWPLRDAKSMKIIRNGYFYTMESNDDTGMREIVRYRFEIE